MTGSALKNWVIAQVLDSFAAGLLWAVGLYALQVRLAWLWALLAAMFQIIPHLGPVLALIGPVVATAIWWRDWEHLIGVLILYVLIALVDGFLLQPYIMRRTAKVPIWASILAPIVLGILWPFWGVLLALPLLAVVYAYMQHYQKSSNP